MTRNALAAWNNEAFEEGNGRQSFCTVLRVSLKTLDTGILLSAVFTLELEIDYPSETSLCTVAPSPTDTPSPIFFREGAVVHRLSEMDSPSSNFPLKLTDKQTDKVRRIVHSKLKPFHFQIEWYYLSDANYQTDNPSHTDNPSLVWNAHECRAPASSWAFACLLLLFQEDYF